MVVQGTVSTGAGLRAVSTAHASHTAGGEDSLDDGQTCSRHTEQGTQPVVPEWVTGSHSRVAIAGPVAMASSGFPSGRAECEEAG